MKTYPNGLGESTGDSLATAKDFSIVGLKNVVYLSSVTGSDSNTGLSRTNPFATLSAAVAASATYGIIVVMSGHAETLSAAQTISLAGLKIIGAGSGVGSMPAFTRSSTTAKLFNMTGAGVELRNLYFPVSTGANSTAPRVYVGSTDQRLIGCYFACGANDQLSAVEVAAARAGFRNNTFISTSTTTKPFGGVICSAAVTGLRFDGDIFDGGTKGWSNDMAADMGYTSGLTITNLIMENISLLRDSDIGGNANNIGHIQIGASSGSARLTGFE